jgi:hypothetical protein
MADLHIGYVDKVAAVGLAREFGLSLDDDRMADLARHLADHRASSVDLALVKIRGRISDVVLRILSDARSFRSSDWSDGCRSAEASVMAVIGDVMREVQPRVPRTKGQILRDMLRHSRERAAANPEYIVTDVSGRS